MSSPLLQLIGVSKSFPAGDARIEVLRDAHLVLERGSSTAIMGPSGSGKSTILNLIGTLDRPDAGSIELGGVDVTARRAADRDIAMVFQSYALYPHLTAAQNMALPLAMRRLSVAQRLPFVGGFLPGARAIRKQIQEDAVFVRCPGSSVLSEEGGAGALLSSESAGTVQKAVHEPFEAHGRFIKPPAEFGGHPVEHGR